MKNVGNGLGYKQYIFWGNKIPTFWIWNGSSDIAYERHVDHEINYKKFII